MKRSTWIMVGAAVVVVISVGLMSKHNEESKTTKPIDEIMKEGAAGLETTLRDKPWMEGFLRAMGVNPRTGPMPPLSPAEKRCKQMIDRQSQECRTDSAQNTIPECNPDQIQHDIEGCEADLKQEWMAQHTNMTASPSPNSPSTSTSTEPTANGYWYYCSNPPGYYPQVQTCNNSWQKVASQTSQSETQNQSQTTSQPAAVSPVLQQRIDDARALTAEQWAVDSQLIIRIVVGYRCGVVDNLSANVATISVGNIMAKQQIQNGLNGDTAMVARQEMEKAVAQGNALVGTQSDPEFCSKFFPDPADRAKLRQIVNGLMQ